MVPSAASWLYSFGGLAIGSSNLAQRWQRVAVYFAGPAAQLILFVPIALLKLYVEANPLSVSRLARAGIVQLWYINLYWPLLNLLPIWPLDGGRISRETFEWKTRFRGTEYSLYLSISVAILLALYQFRPLFPDLLDGSMYMAFFFAFFAFNNYQELQFVRQQNQHWDDWRDRGRWH